MNESEMKSELSKLMDQKKSKEERYDFLTDQAAYFVHPTLHPPPEVVNCTPSSDTPLSNLL